MIGLCLCVVCVVRVCCLWHWISNVNWLILILIVCIEFPFEWIYTCIMYYHCHHPTLMFTFFFISQRKCAVTSRKIDIMNETEKQKERYKRFCVIYHEPLLTHTHKRIILIVCSGFQQFRFGTSDKFMWVHFFPGKQNEKKRTIHSWVYSVQLRLRHAMHSFHFIDSRSLISWRNIIGSYNSIQQFRWSLNHDKAYGRKEKRKASANAGKMIRLMFCSQCSSCSVLSARVFGIRFVFSFIS